jgi:hypothetical protein
VSGCSSLNFTTAVMGSADAAYCAGRKALEAKLDGMLQNTHTIQTLDLIS